MQEARHWSRLDTFGLKCHIEKKLGHLKAENYFNLLTRYFSFKIRKSEFDKLCIGLLGRENINLHNGFVRAIIKNSCLAKTPPPKQDQLDSSFKVPNGYQRTNLQSLFRDVLPHSPRKGRTPNLRDRKFRDRPSPLGPFGKTHAVAYEDLLPKVQEQQSATELLSLGSRPPLEVNSVEEGEEVEQAAVSPGVYSRSPVIAPLGIFTNTGGTRKVPHNWLVGCIYTDTCTNSGELPDACSLKKRLECKMEREGLTVSTDCANLLNNALDVYLKKLLKPCTELARSRVQSEHSNQIHNQMTSRLNGVESMRYVQTAEKPFSVSMVDFQAAMELNPRILGEDWPILFEKVCLHASEESI